MAFNPKENPHVTVSNKTVKGTNSVHEQITAAPYQGAATLRLRPSPAMVGAASGAPGAACWASLLVSLMVTSAASGRLSTCRHNVQGSAHDFGFLALNERHNVSMEAYRGKVVLLVNVATY